MVPTDLLHAALIHLNRLCEEHLEYDIAGVAAGRFLSGPLGGAVGQKGVGGQIQPGEASAAESVSLGASRGQHQDHVVVGSVHAVEVCEVQADAGVQQASSGDLEAQGAVGGVSGRQARVKLRVATEEDSVQLAVDGRTVTAAAVFQGWTHQTSTLPPEHKHKGQFGIIIFLSLQIIFTNSSLKKKSVSTFSSNN